MSGRAGQGDRVLCGLTASEGGRRVTITRPDGQTEITDYYRDGKIKSVSGAGVVHRAYRYGVESDGSQWTEVLTGTSNPAVSSWDRYVRTSTDMLGRAYCEERPAAHPATGAVLVCNKYEDGTGRLEFTTTEGNGSTALLPATIYEYDELGNVVRTAVDLNGDEDLDLGTDRVIGSDTYYAEHAGEWWRESESSIYLNGSTELVTGYERQQLTGLGGTSTNGILTAKRQSVDIKGNVTTTATEYESTTKAVIESVTVPWASTVQRAVSRLGLLLSSTSTSNLTTTYAYDGLGRRVTVTDPRTGAVTTTYSATTGQVTQVEQLDGSTTVQETIYDYYANGQLGAGRVKSVANWVSGSTYLYTRYAYTDRGEVFRVWGDAPQPVEFEYSSYGERTKMRTYRAGSGWDGSTWPGSPGTADETVWVYDDATGVLVEKVYPALSTGSESTLYSYTPDGRLYERSWARGVTTTYGYYDNSYVSSSAFSGQLRQIDYSDSTPDVTFAYTRDGRLSSVVDATGTRSFGYDVTAPTLELVSESLPDAFFGANRDLSRGYTSTQVGQLNNIQVGVIGGAAEYSVSYEFDSATGRMARVTGPGLPAYGVTYGYVTHSDLVGQVDYKSNSSTIVARTTRSYEPKLNLLTQVKNVWGNPGGTHTVVSQYAYRNDSLSRRKDVVRTGAAFEVSGGSGQHMDKWTYNARSELTGSDRFAGTNPDSPGAGDDDFDRAYTYDPIGNRTSHADGTGPAVIYGANALNQYLTAQLSGSSPLISQAFIHDEDGNLVEMYAGGDIDGDGEVGLADLGLLLQGYNVSTCADPDPLSAAEFDRADIDDDCAIGLGDLGALTASYGLRSSGSNRLHLTWDGESRLIAVEPLSLFDGAYQLEFAYDYLNRRVEKRVWQWDDTNQEWDWVDGGRFVWHDWLLVEELKTGWNASSGQTELIGGAGLTPVVRRNTWGLDLAGLAGASGGGGAAATSIDSAGGIGGLLSVLDTAATTSSGDDVNHVFLYDANGNVGQLLDAASSGGSPVLTARYEYDAYGNIIGPDTDADGGWTDDAGAYATVNPWRFSTKQRDDQTPFGYWGGRYLDFSTGQWISRDPIEERGDINLYRNMSNQLVNRHDKLGLITECPLPAIPPFETPATGNGFSRQEIRLQILGCTGCGLRPRPTLYMSSPTHPGASTCAAFFQLVDWRTRRSQSLNIYLALNVITVATSGVTRLSTYPAGLKR